jgi:hypothetical protein
LPQPKHHFVGSGTARNLASRYPLSDAIIAHLPNRTMTEINGGCGSLVYVKLRIPIGVSRSCEKHRII